MLTSSGVQTFPLLATKTDVISGTNPISTYLTATHSTYSAILLGSDTLTQAKISQWIEFTKLSIAPLHSHLIGQLAPGFVRNEETFKLAHETLKTLLSRVNSHLALRTYLVGHSITLADLYLTVYLADYLECIIEATTRSSFPCLTRWFTNIAENPLVRESLYLTSSWKSRVM